MKTVSKPPRATTNNQQRSISFANSGGVQYFYDAQNKRVWQATCLPGSCTPGSTWILYTSQVNLFGADGKQLASYSPLPAWNNTSYNQVAITFGPVAVRSYFGGRLVAQQSGVNTYQPVIQDRLGSVGKYYPYGEERNSPQLPNDQVKFATYTRDSATGNDYADQRYYTSVLGRFMTADPSSASAGAADPASWNRYAYTRGDPVNRFDSFGTCDQSADTSTSITVCGTTDPVSGTAGSSIAGQGAPSNYLGPWVAQALATAAAVGNNYLASLQAGAIHYGSTSFDQAFTSLTSDLGDISAQFKNLQSADCEADLKAAGVTDAQVVAYAQGLSIVDGLGPAAITTTYAYAAYGNSLAYSSAATLWGGVTVAMYMAINLPGGVAAVAQAPGNTVYINAGWVNGMTTSQQEGMLVHELLHNITGIGDWDLQTALGLPHTVSQNIGDKLEKDCFQ